MPSTALFALQLLAVWVSVTSACDFPIRRSRVQNAWQSSFGDGNTCFYSRSEADETHVTGTKSFSYRFFHSNDKDHSDGGFHWFAVQLHESVLIRSVTVKGREGDHFYSVSNRSVDIEVWTSNSIVTNVSGDHCSANGISKWFNKSYHKWRLCGITKSSNISAGELFNVSCVAEVRHILLRKKASSDDGYMTFSDLRLQTMQMSITKPQVVAENSNFSVQCLLGCSGTELSMDSTNETLQLCFTNNSCTNASMTQVGSAKPEHAGTYKCILGSVERSTTVAVLTLNSTSRNVAQNSSFTVSCSLHCNGTQLCTDSWNAALKNATLCSHNDMKCSNKHKMEIARAQLTDSGNYTCRLGSVELRTEVTVFYLLPSVSISVMPSNSCKNLSDVKVTFTSAASHPPAEHRCRAQTGGVTLNMSRNGSVSLWSFSNEERMLNQEWISVTITCSAVQILPNGVKFSNATSAELKLCGQGKTMQSLLKILACTFCLIFVVILVGAVLLSRFIKRREEAVTLANLIYSVERLSVMPTQAAEEPEASEPAEAECRYFTVRPAGVAADAAEIQDSDSDGDSDSCVFLEIVADCDISADAD